MVSYFRDAVALAGLAMLFGGFWWVYPPSALIVCGVILLTFAIWGHLNEPAETADRQE